MSPKAAFHTLGCKVNQYETEVLKKQFREKGYEIVDEKEFADVYVINTCTVTHLADRKSRQYIRKMKKLNPGSFIAVTGCYAQVSPEEAASLEEVDLVAGTAEKGRLAEYVSMAVREAERNGGRPARILLREVPAEYEETGVITSMENRSRAFLKIQEGCNRFCSYCIIPYARGSVRSRRAEDIVAEAEALIGKGFRELVLTGINTALYGAETDPPGMGLAKILRKLDRLKGDFRIRLSSLEPTVADEETLRRLLSFEKLCRHLHFSVQSGSDTVLARMNRRYTAASYEKMTALLRDRDPLFGISTDLIVGFPGETEEEFACSLDLVRRMEFCRIHVFRYSRRRGTPAASMGGQISSAEKNRRSRLLIEEGARGAGAFAGRCRGAVRKVLIEEREGAFWTGYGDNYLKVYLPARSPGGNAPEPGFREPAAGSFAEVRIGEPFEDGAMGEFA